MVGLPRHGVSGVPHPRLGETPGDGVQASVVIANNYVESGGRAHIVSNASENVTVSGLAFSFDKRSLARQISGVNYAVSAIMNDAPSLTVDNCSFLQARPSDGWCQSGRGGIVHCESTNLVVRNCRFENIYSLKSSGDKFTAVQFLRSATIVGSVFSNVTYAASAKENSSTVYSLVFVSNVVYGAVGGGYKSGEIKGTDPLKIRLTSKSIIRNFILQLQAIERMLIGGGGENNRLVRIFLCG